MELHQLRYFVAVARTGSMSRAAEQCRVAQPSLSQQIKKLEASLDATLFDRLPRGVALTDAGRALRPRAERILREVEAIGVHLSDDVDEGVGSYAIGAIPTIAPYLLPEAVATVRRAFPRCQLSVREDLTERLVEQVANQELDAAVVSTPIEDDRIDLRVVGTERLLVVSPTSEAFMSSGRLTLEELRDVPRISLHEMHCLGRQIAGFCAMRRIGANVVCRTAQLATLLELVRMGLGVSLVPEMAARHDRDPGRRYAPLDRATPTRDIAVATRAGRAPGRITERVTGLLAERLGAAETGPQPRTAQR